MKIFGLSIRSATAARLEAEDLAWYKKRFQFQRGASTLVPNANPYSLLSTNSGKDWYAIEKDGTIIGKAEEVFPGLLENRAAWKAITQAVETSGGPLDIALPENQKLFEAAGFEFTNK
jgi:hypothetical protein